MIFAARRITLSVVTTENCNLAGMARGKFVTHRVYNRYTIGYRSVS